MAPVARADGGAVAKWSQYSSPETAERTADCSSTLLVPPATPAKFFIVKRVHNWNNFVNGLLTTESQSRKQIDVNGGPPETP